MQQKNSILKYKILLFFYFIIPKSIFSQPGSGWNEYNFEVNLCFKDIENRILNFNINKDILISKKKKLTIRFYEFIHPKEKFKDKYDIKNIDKYDSRFFIQPTKKGVIFFKNTFCQAFKKKIITVLEIEKNNKKMLINFDFTEFDCNQDIYIGTIDIKFREGDYKIVLGKVDLKHIAGKNSQMINIIDPKLIKI